MRDKILQSQEIGNKVKLEEQIDYPAALLNRKTKERLYQKE